MNLTQRQQDVLDSLAGHLSWLRPMDIGGRDSSHHSQTLAGLAQKDLVERKHRSGSTAWLYRITEAGEAARRQAYQSDGSSGNVYVVPDDGGSPLSDLSERPSLVAPVEIDPGDGPSTR